MPLPQERQNPRMTGGFTTSWSGRRDSNPRPSPWQGDALPAEPRPQSGFENTSPRGRTGQLVALICWSKIDGHREDSIDHLPRRIPDNGEIHVVLLGLFDERLALIPSNRWQRALFDRFGPIPKAGKHRIDIERSLCISHVTRVAVVRLRSPRQPDHA